MFKVKDKFNWMKKRKLFLGIIFLMILFSVLVILRITSTNSSLSSSYSTVPGVQQKITEENLASYLSFNSIIQDLPEDASISLKVGKNEYAVQKGRVVPGVASKPDVRISIPNKYIKELSNGLCSALSKANKNKELSVEYYSSKISLAWKYRSLRNYAGCLG